MSAARANVRVTARRVVAAACALCLVAAADAAEQAATLRGRVINTLSGETVANATVVIEELTLETKSASDGQYVIDNIPPGRYHVAVRAAPDPRAP